MAALWIQLKKVLFFRPFIACFLLLVLYQILVFGGAIAPSNGINQFQTNTIKAQRYLHDRQNDLQMVLVGSSIANNIQAEYIAPPVVNLGMAGGCAQTGLEIVRENTLKPNVVLVEMNSTIERGEDRELVEALFNPFWRLVRDRFSIFRQEYRPVSAFVDNLRKENRKSTNLSRESIQDSPLRQKEIERIVAENSSQLPEELKAKIEKEAEVIKSQIADLEQAGIQAILVEFPGEKVVKQTVRYRQVRELTRSLFPRDRYQWLPDPPDRDWIASDGIHLIAPDAQVYGAFLKEQVLEPLSN